jgi:hypothetical protein
VTLNALSNDDDDDDDDDGDDEHARQGYLTAEQRILR